MNNILQALLMAAAQGAVGFLGGMLWMRGMYLQALQKERSRADRLAGELASMAERGGI